MAKAKGKHLKKTAPPRLPTLMLALLLILGGAGIFLYPSLSNLYSQHHHANVIQSYSESVDSAAQEQMEKAWKDALIYNENLLGDPVHDPFVPGSGYVLPENYMEVLNMDNSGVMAYIDIPIIAVELPIYHGTSEDVLEKGVGHLQQTALPIGGEGRHSVLTGHRGLPSAMLFTRLDQLEIGDVFYISVLDQVLAYEVSQINTVLPYELEKLAAVSGEDLVTLVTCTPYGVNTHRLLVTGSRIEYSPENDFRDSSRVVMELRKMDSTSRNIGIALGIVLLFAFYVLLSRKMQRR